MTTTAHDSSLAELIDLDTNPEQIATGFVFTEGPVWHSGDRSLIFSDVRGATMYRWTEATGAQVFRQPSGGSNGNTYDRQGRLVTCEHGNRRVSRTLPDGRIESLAERYQGNRLSSPNDVICTRSGDIIFTDPPYGLRQPDGSIKGQEVPFNGVFRAAAGSGDLSVLVDDLDRPNGLVLSDDQTRMYIADTSRQHIRLVDVIDGNRLSNSRIFVEGIQGHTDSGIGWSPDGMKLDSRGNLYVAANTTEGIWVFNPQGKLIGEIGLPEQPANLAWGGDGWRTIFATARTSVYRVQMKVAGQPVPLS